jgi:hypothetical protein
MAVSSQELFRYYAAPPAMAIRFSSHAARPRAAGKGPCPALIADHPGTSFRARGGLAKFRPLQQPIGKMPDHSRASFGPANRQNQKGD